MGMWRRALWRLLDAVGRRPLPGAKRAVAGLYLSWHCPELLFLGSCPVQSARSRVVPAGMDGYGGKKLAAPAYVLGPCLDERAPGAH